MAMKARVPRLVMVAAGAMGLCSCAHARPGLQSASDLSITMSGTEEAGRPAVVLVGTNRSGRDICVSNDLLRNQKSGFPLFKLKIGAGQVRKRDMSGYLLPPVEGETRIKPGEEFRTTQFIDWIFRIPGGSKIQSGNWSAKVTLPYRDCATLMPYRSESAWLRL